MFGWITPRNKFIDCEMYNHLRVIVDNDEAKKIVKIQKLWKNLETIREGCEEDTEKHGSCNAEWHVYEMAQDATRYEIWNLLMQNGFLRIGCKQDLMYFEGRPFALKDKAEFCKKFAEGFGCHARFEPVKKDSWDRK